MRNKIIAVIDNLGAQDYLLIGASFFLFLLCIILALVLRKNVLLASLSALFGFLILLLGPTFGLMQLHNYLYKNSLTLTHQQKLQFTNGVVVRGVIVNESQRDFSFCKLYAEAYKISGNPIFDFLFPYNPFTSEKHTEYDILQQEKREFTIIIKNFTYEGEFGTSLGAICR
jgi:hypothetical protein